jgi:cation diffusion facilitator CzcD-associated flavoprotein CzcO
MADVDVLVVGAGITGIYQLYRARAAGFTATLLEAGDGVGGTWFWNRYPGARFDSESYTYGYLFSRELFDEWEWSEHFAEQPEIERYLNHVVDKFDLRRSMEFGARVTSAVWSTDHWDVTCEDGRAWRTRFFISATGVLSVPYFPDVPGRESFGGEQFHTGLWPAEAVDFRDKRVAVVGTGSSGVQIVPVIADQCASLTVYQRSANWCTPLNNAPITDEEQRALRAEFEQMCAVLNTSVAGFLHQPHDRGAFDDNDDERRVFFERMWNSPGFAKLSSNYLDLLFNEAANGAWCAFIQDKIRSIVRDKTTADLLIPTHRYGQKRPPFVTGYYEAFNLPHVRLVDVNVEPIDFDQFDIVVWATGFDFGTGALARMGVVGRGGVALNDHWADGPSTFLGVCTHGFPNFFFPGGPHAAAGNNPRYIGDQFDFITETLMFAGDRVIEVTEEAEARWTEMIDRAAQTNPFGELGQYFGTNIPGKPRRYLLNAGGRPKLFKEIARVKDTNYAAFSLL